MRRPVIALLGIALVLGLTGCGESSKLYPSSKSEGVFFSVPTNWKALSTASLNKYEKESTEPEGAARQALVKWQIAYTTNKKLKAAEVFNLTAPTKPLAFARVRDLENSEINSVSYNTLRDVIVPVTQIIEGDDPSAPDFQILVDQEVVQKGARGVQTVYSFSIDGKEQTINQTSLMSNDRTTMYIFVVRCTTECYNKNKKKIEEIVSSFTVEGAR
ncbi:MAG: lipoprotein [Candidatus Planktophila sp.]